MRYAQLVMGPAGSGKVNLNNLKCQFNIYLIIFLYEFMYSVKSAFLDIRYYIVCKYTKYLPTIIL